MFRSPRWLQRLARLLAASEPAGRFDLSLLAGDLVFTGWLAFAQRAFLNQPPAAWGQIALAAALVALLAWLWRWHDLRGLVPLVARGGAVGLTAAGGLLVLSLAGGCSLSRGEISWLAAAAVVVLLVMRCAHRAARRHWPDRPGEILRWIAVVSAVLALVWPFCTADALGAGDADWYTTMLADFIAQWRAGTFPVWIGQSEFAFNGAVSPLRFAPWFQHWGAVLDLLTGHALLLTALKNAALVTSALTAGLAAYAALGSILHRRPWLAALLAILWMASPGALAPLMVGDQYMTFLALPFVAVTLYGIWRMWAQDDRPARLALAVGPAGLWLSHPPIALWMCLLAGANYAAKIALRGTWRREPRRLAAMGAGFLLLGSFPFLSTRALDNMLPMQALGGSAYDEITRVFPRNFLPIAPAGDGLMAYQLGYTALGAFAATLLLLAVARPRGAVPGVLGSAAIAFFVLPVPGITRWIWTSLPGWFVAIDNIWPMQRLFPIWTAMIFFGLAIVAAHERIARRRWLVGLLTAGLLGGAAWSWHEARKLAQMADKSRFPADQAARLMGPNNVLLTRYAYSSFIRAPAYASHSYMSPFLENRLLDPQTLKVILANADAAAPRLQADGIPETGAFPRLVQAGTFTAVNDNHSDSYNLTPPIVLRPDISYALRLEFLNPEEHGVLQLMDPRLFREYYLPDSGAGMSHWGPPLAFGSGPQSSKVIPLKVLGNGDVTPRLFFISPHQPQPTFPFARFWLFTYENSRLPVAVQSWIPYRAQVQTAVAAWLETPRIWQSSWRARVNGRDASVQRSPQNLVMVAVEPGESQVVLEYRPPWWLQASYWGGLLGWGALLVIGAARLGAAGGDPARAP